jgi:methylphosphotriester-DNA--protein-cysteine methyltransferase
MKRWRFLIRAILVAVILAASFAFAADFKYVGSKKSDKYHYPTYKWAKKINPENLVTFASAKDAQTAGYVPCKVCKPPHFD